MARELALDHPLLGDDEVETILPAVETERERKGLAALDRRQTLGALLIAAGLVAVLGAWFGISGTNNTTDQLSYLASGGLGGAGLILVGSLFFVSQEHSRDREALTQAFTELDGRVRKLEEGLAAEFDHLYSVLGTSAPTQPAQVGRR
ncbi:MAG TPA: hypothetical protein VEG38_01335 [Acidimicrobiia bacterium]|nr:hypothetical protein [Acidimicrobiia bacterium]